MGCPGCLPTEKERQQAIQAVSKKAKAHAIKLQKLMVIYSFPDGTFDYMEAAAAQAIGLQPLGFVSHFEPAADGPLP